MGEKVSITRALKELKLLDERIKKEITGTLFADVYQGRSDKAIISGITKAEFETRASTRLQSIEDLIKRRNKIKSALLLSNSNTKVTIAGKEFLVVEAIDQKSAIEYEKMLIEKMRKDITLVKKKSDENRAVLEGRIDKMLEQTLGTEKKVDESTYKQIADPIMEANELKILDPVKVEKIIDEKDKYIDEFLAEVDFVLSESNSKTEIEL